MPRPAGESEVAFGMIYPDGTISDIECFPEEITPEEYREIIKWQARSGSISEEEANEILAWMDRNIVRPTDGGGS
jgi:hypothetical protein